LFLEYWASTPHRREAASFWVDLLVEFKEVVAGIVEEGIHSREFKPVDAESLVRMIMAAYDGLATYSALMPDLDLQRSSVAFVDVVISGLSVDGSEGE